MTFPEALCLRKCSANHLMHKCVLIYDDFSFMDRRGVSHHPGVTERLFSVAPLSRMLKNVTTVFFELKLKTDVQQSYPAV
jgi:hypothetical protein